MIWALGNEKHQKYQDNSDIIDDTKKYYFSYYLIIIDDRLLS